MGDEIGQRNDPSYAEQPDLAEDNRWLHRPMMDGAAAERRHEQDALEARIYQELQALVALRRATPELHAQAAAEALWSSDPRVFTLLRSSARGDVLVLANVSPHALTTALPAHWGAVLDLVTGEDADGQVALAEYQVRWLRRR